MINNITSRFSEACTFLLNSKQASNNRELAKNLGISPQMITEIGKGRSNVGLTAIQNIVSIYGINPNWMLTGNGDMLQNGIEKYDPASGIIHISVQENEKIGGLPPINKIPLSELSNHNGRVLTYDKRKYKSAEKINHALPILDMQKLSDFLPDIQGNIIQRILPEYVIPEFCNIGANFLIRIIGNDMAPTFGNGDIVACKHIPIHSFLQWGKAYIIVCKHENMIKRLFEGENGTILCKSDNNNYPPVQLEKSQILYMARVVGCIKTE